MIVGAVVGWYLGDSKEEVKETPARITALRLTITVNGTLGELEKRWLKLDMDYKEKIMSEVYASLNVIEEKLDLVKDKLDEKIIGKAWLENKKRFQVLAIKYKNELR